VPASINFVVNFEMMNTYILNILHISKAIRCMWFQLVLNLIEDIRIIFSGNIFMNHSYIYADFMHE